MDKTILTKKRVLKASVTRLKDKISKCDLNDCEKAQIEIFKNKIVELNEEVCALFQNIFSACQEDKEVDTFISEKDELQDSLDELLIAVNRVITIQSDCSVVKPSTSKTEVSEVKLPKLSLPSFNGQTHDWLSFKDLFTACIHKNTSLSQAQKLQYLKLSCRGDALRVIQSIPIEDANYSIAWDLLSERFSNKRELIYSHIKKIMAQPYVNSESPSAILNIVDTTNECVRSFEILDQKVSEFSETLIIYLILQKLDSNLKLWWERQLKGDELPTLNQLTNFLKDYARSLQSSGVSSNFKRGNFVKLTTMTASIHNYECKCCKSSNHTIYKCPEFLKLSVNDRVHLVKSKKLCFNCLNSNHKLSDCLSKKACVKCNLKSHHSFLHFERKEKTNKANAFQEQVASSNFPYEGDEISKAAENVNSPLNSCFGKLSDHKLGILATALINVKDAYGGFKLLRCIIDVGSTANFISESAIQLLGLKRSHANLQIKCLGSNAGDVTRGILNLTFSPHFDKQYTQSATFYVLKNITSDQPYVAYDPNSLHHLRNITLADPKWFEPGQIDVLLGVSISLSAIRGEKIYGKPGTPFAINSDLGWLVAGDSEVLTETKPRIIVNHATLQDEYVKRFWELENVPLADIFTTEEKKCEEFFEATHARESDGRYVVRLPFKKKCYELGESKTLAMKRFLNLEKRFQKEPEMHKNYSIFMKEYLDLKHMEKIPVCEIEKPINESYYLPHHPVIRESSSTTRLRVVFDGSAKTTTGVSLNDNLLVGPRVQQELFFILLRFRTHSVAINADIAKMFRQIKVFPEDQNFQRILWRDKSSEDLSVYRLTTVTYGLASSPYLSTRVLQQLAEDEKLNYPLASAVVLRDFYVDDLLCGASSAQEAIQLISQLQEIMKKGGFELRKWSSNDPTVLQSIPEQLIQTKSDLNIEKNSVFPSEIKCITSNKCLPCNSKLISLSPFIDKDGILRVGGRLRHANVAQDQMHPILLPKSHPVTELIVRHYHLSHLHAGSQLLLSALRQQYWIPSGRDVVRRFVRKCITCARLSASISKQMMADLPPSRVQPSRPFLITGIDYAGPVLCKFKSGRGIKSFKCYIAIFVCFSTRAIHLELVSDLSTQAFLASLKRFVARRGKPKEIVSDCATLLAQIESCLNSRPLCPLSSDPTDLTALTPGHFLIGAPLISIPEGDVSDVPESRLNRWQHVQRVFQHFWKRWSGEYLSNLQQRPKWYKEEPNIKIGDLVLIKHENLSPLHWKLARVIKTHPGPDKKVRVVTLKTETGELKRPISKLCKLPLE